MILNERQLNVTKKQIIKFEQAIAKAKDLDTPKERNEQLRQKYHLESLNGQLETLKQEVSEYEQLKLGNIKSLASSFESLPETLIKARIICGLSQAQLAERLQVTPQQVQKDESNLYLNSSFTKLLRVKNALDLDISGTVTFC